MRKIWCVFLFWICCLYAFSLSINEIMPCNISSYLNDKKDFTGWIEFYNEGSQNVNLNGWTIEHQTIKKNKLVVKWTYQLVKDFKISAGGYKVMSFDNAEGSTHVPYNLDVDGGYIFLYAPDGTLYAIFDYPTMKPHISYGVYKTGLGYMLPTPADSNSKSYGDVPFEECQCLPPTFGETQPGVFEEQPSEGDKVKRKVTLSCATKDAEIRYTTDGKEPTSTSDLYDPETTKISFTSTLCLRARAFKKGLLPSDIVTGSFIVYENRKDCEGTDAPVVSIVTDKKFLTDAQIGIHTIGDAGIPGEKSCVSNNANYNRDWHRAANFEYFVKGGQKVSQETMIAIMGGCSRKYDVKSLKITTSKRTGNENFGYNFFASEKGKENNVYSSLQLRNGGNAYESVRCRDGFMQTIAKQMGNIDYQAYQPVSYYLNGTYMGFMGLRERTNEDFISANYGLDKDKVDIIEFNQKSPEVCAGDDAAYREMVRFVTDSNNYKRDDYLLRLSNYMDVEEYLNYMIFEQFIVNTDWPANNQKMWRKHVGGKFRWILYDTDFGFGLYDDWSPNYCNKNLNMIKWCMGTGDERNWGNSNPETYQIDKDNEWKTIFFRSLMKNKEFGKMYLTKALMLLSTTLSGDNIENTWNSFKETVKKEHCVNKTVASSTGSLSSTGEAMVNFAKDRNGIFKDHLASFFKVEKEGVNLELSCSNESAGFYVNNVPVNKNSYKLKCMTNMEVTIRPILPSGYIVDKWMVDSVAQTGSSVTVTMKAAHKVKLVLKEEGYARPLIRINEICSKNSIFVDDESGETSDWLELYNISDDYIDVAGYYLSDNDTTVQIPSGYGYTNIPPKGYLLLWADDRGKSGAKHLDFKISDQGEMITLTKKVRDSTIIVDVVSFGPIGENNSFGRTPTDLNKWAIYERCQNNAEYSSASPGEENGKYDCATILQTLTNKVTLTCASNNVSYDVNGIKYPGGNATAYVKKGKTLTVSPVLPNKVSFVKWKLSVPIESYTDILTEESKWFYHYADSAPSGNWKTLNYTSAWDSGVGRFGYDEKENSTREYQTKLKYKGKRYITAYFRNVFNLQDTTGLERLVANLTFDDGVVFYVNGKELKRYNMPSDSIIAYSDTTPDYQDDVTKVINIFPSDLKKGENVIAVEVHQFNAESSDLTFACNVKARYMNNFTNAQTFTVELDTAFSATLYVEDNSDSEEPVSKSTTPHFYPNPTSASLFLTNCTEQTKVVIYDQIGKVLSVQVIDDETQPIKMDSFLPGVYFVEATSEKQYVRGKILKR